MDASVSLRPSVFATACGMTMANGGDRYHCVLWRFPSFFVVNFAISSINFVDGFDDLPSASELNTKLGKNKIFPLCFSF